MNLCKPNKYLSKLNKFVSPKGVRFRQVLLYVYRFIHYTWYTNLLITAFVVYMYRFIHNTWYTNLPITAFVVYNSEDQGVRQCWVVSIDFIIPSPTKLRKDIVMLRPSFCNILVNTLESTSSKIGTCLVLKRIWNPIDFQCQRSRSPGQIFETIQYALCHRKFSYMINQKFMKLCTLQDPNMKMCTLAGYTSPLRFTPVMLFWT